MRIAVIGTSGAGKSTYARTLAARLGVPAIELDAINWQAGWRDLNTHDPDAFVQRVEAAIAADAWVCDGNYSRVRSSVLGRATHILWLDFSLTVVMGRVIRRSLSRAMTGTEIWPGTGNRETFAMWLDKEHPIRWAWATHHRRRGDFALLFGDEALAHAVRHRLRHPREAAGLIERLAREAGAAPSH